MSKEDFPLPTLGPLLAEVLAEVLKGRGFALLRGLPVDRWSRKETLVAYWGELMVTVTTTLLRIHSSYFTAAAGRRQEAVWECGIDGGCLIKFNPLCLSMCRNC